MSGIENSYSFRDRNLTSLFEDHRQFTEQSPWTTRTNLPIFSILVSVLENGFKHDFYGIYATMRDDFHAK